MFSYKDLTEEQTKKLIDNLAYSIVKRGLEEPAMYYLVVFKPMAFVGTQFAMLGVPFLSLFGGIGDQAYDTIRLLENRKNIERLVQRIETLRDEKENKLIDRSKEKENKSEEKAPEKKESIKRFFSKILSRK